MPYKEKEDVQFKKFCDKKTNSAVTKKILTNICAGNNILFSNQTINDSNRKVFHDVFMELYSRSLGYAKEMQRTGIAKAKENKKYKGRKPIKVDELCFLDMLLRISKKEITSKQAAGLLHISIDKFYRERKRIAALKTYPKEAKAKTSDDTANDSCQYDGRKRKGTA